MKRISFILAVVIVLFIGLTIPVHGLPNDSDLSSLIGTVNISSPFPDSPSDTTAYRTITNPNDVEYYSVSDLEKIRNNVTSTADAPQVALDILNGYGGLPHDAILVTSETEYLIEMNGTTQEEVTRYPVCTNVQYGRKINDVPVVGDGAYINIELGDNGELLYLNKVWRSVIPDGNISIIPPSAAIEKLRHGEVLNPKSDPHNVNITRIRLGYYEKGRNESQEYLEPAWLFRGTTDTGESIKYYVYARHFANFTTSATNISAFQTIQFTDTSETTPTRWNWDFGDGISSTEQNPSHMYRSAGNFSVSLKAWNDMGSDTETKTGFIRVSITKPLNADFTATPLIASTDDSISFSDRSDTSPTRWYWDFGDGKSSTLRNPTHAYTTGGNYTVSLTAGNANGNDTRSMENYIRIYPDPKPVAGFTTNASWEHDLPPLAIAFTDTSTGTISSWYWDFSDGTGSSDQNPIHTFTINETNGWFNGRTIYLTVTDSFGRKSQYYDFISIGREYHPDFQSEPVSGTFPLTVNFSVTGEDFLYKYDCDFLWDFGDGTTATWNPWDYPEPRPNVTHTYSSPGNYTVTLSQSVGDVGTFIQTKPDYIIVGDPTQVTTADFTANTTTGMSPLAVAFTDTTLGFPASWTWDFGDGESSPERNPVHTYPDAGTYSVSLIVTNAGGSNSSVKPDYITVFPSRRPVADFTANTTQGRSPLAVVFTDLSTNRPVNWSWSFGDGTDSSDQDPVHVYTTPGRYPVSLRVMNDDGGDTLTRTEYITVLMELPEATIQPQQPVLPFADFTATPVSGKEPLTVVFNDLSTGFPTGWSWSFGDGTTSPEKNPVHTYPSAGTYTVILTASNPFGSNSTTREDHVTVSPRVLPVALFTANTSSGRIPLAVAFTDTSDGNPTSWAWAFGDGGTSAEQDPVHVYTSAGQFTVSLEVRNPDGSNTTSIEQLIRTGAPDLPLAEFTANLTSGRSPLAVGFTDESTGSPDGWYWTFGDGSFSTEQDPAHVYTSPGVYTVSLEVTNPDGGNTRMKTDYIMVSSLSPPSANFTGRPTCGKAPLAVTFSDMSTGIPATWTWDFGDGTTTTERNPSHTFTAAGKYTISLTVTNAGGSNTSTRKDYVTVSGQARPPVANFNAKPTYGKAPLSVKFIDTSSNSPTRWNWNFGDGTSSTEQHPEHIYTIPGKYTVSLSAINSAGSTMKTRAKYITVKQISPPTANFAGKPTYGKSPLTVVFNDTSTGLPNRWVWDFGDGTVVTDQHPVHTYATAGKYTVSLKASNAGGSTTKTRSRYITVSGPTPHPTPTPTTTCTHNSCEPYSIPQMNGVPENGKIRLTWNVITNPCLQGYKLVISRNNPHPKYPDDGYMFWITDRNQNYSWIKTTDHYNGGDFGGYLQPGQDYYFSITAVYPDAKVPGNVVRLAYPSPVQTMTALPAISPGLTRIPALTGGLAENDLPE
jgi:PKD repeat protein